MKFIIHKINYRRDTYKYAFKDYEYLKTLSGCETPKIMSWIYDEVYRGDNPSVKTIEDAFRDFESQQGKYLKCRAEVSDVITIVESDDMEPGLYYRDTNGYVPVHWDIEPADILTEISNGPSYLGHKPDIPYRQTVVKAMEVIARQINDEDVFESWLLYGVADGDIDIFSDASQVDTYYTDDDNFSELMGLFLHIMSRAKKSGGLYCDNILSKD